MTYTELNTAIEHAWSAFFDSLFESNILVADLDKIDTAMDNKDCYNGVTDAIVSVVDLECEE